MYENMLMDVQKSFRPIMDMVEINTKAAEKMFALQSEYMNSLVNTTMSQMQELTTATDPQQFLDLQVQFVKQIENQFTDVAEKELATINAASDELTGIVKTNLDSMTQSELSYMDEVSKLLTITGMPDFTAVSAAPAANTAPANTAPVSPVAAKPAITSAVKPATKKAAPKPTTKKPAAKKPAAKATTKAVIKPASKPIEKVAAKSATPAQPVVKAASKPATPAQPIVKTTATDTASVKTPAAKQSETKQPEIKA